MKSRYGASDEMCKLNIFCYTLGSPQALQEPLNNIARISFQAMAAVLGGVQTLATTAYDEAIQLPSEGAVRIALRTQQIIAHETGVTRSADPMAGSYVLEELTTRLEGAINDELAAIARLGGALKALESGWIGSKIDEEAFRQQQAIDNRERLVVGVNYLQADDPIGFRDQIKIDPNIESDQIARLNEVRRTRDAARVAATLGSLKRAAAANENTVAAVTDAIRARASVGEVAGTLKQVWGAHRQ
jgi:methylmalonyl-CoA mutase N-terminal domain/subunit